MILLIICNRCQPMRLVYKNIYHKLMSSEIRISVKKIKGSINDFIDFLQQYMFTFRRRYTCFLPSDYVCGSIKPEHRLGWHGYITPCGISTFLLKFRIKN